MRKRIASAFFAASMVAALAVPLLAGSASAAPNANANPNAFAGKVTICHKTGSETNPWVIINPSANSLVGHLPHQDGQDIIAPAGTEVCPPGE